MGQKVQISTTRLVINSPTPPHRSMFSDAHLPQFAVRPNFLRRRKYFAESCPSRPNP
ncbi:MAG TPA: hypothetical protein H9900_05690 [Candidatus Monoglobus merdigallinarum]|uniref:Uncharacterized protein n=1 Tax=Candidatus Monoglobus merdigallinarum TaxID=2838698 RepID=A0A9D1PRE9_9FIRM|nr:hypothetical protein [Candidatus Monoglobus merdigallinarum]